MSYVHVYEDLVRASHQQVVVVAHLEKGPAVGGGMVDLRYYGVDGALRMCLPLIGVQIAVVVGCRGEGVQ